MKREGYTIHLWLDRKLRIKTLIGAERDKRHNDSAEYLLLIGSDEIVPHYRLKDCSSGNHKESAYPGDLTNAAGAAMSTGHTLGDGFYGDAKPMLYEKRGIEFPQPDLKIGRLVQTPEQIGEMIDGYLLREGTIYLYDSFVADTKDSLAKGPDSKIASVGEVDSYWDGADRVKTILEADYLEVKSLSEREVDAFSLVDHLNEGSLLNVLALHGTHTDISLGAGETPLTADRIQKNVNKNGLRGSIVLNLGSHGGLNLDGNDGTGYENSGKRGKKIKQASETDDLVDAFSAKGALAYIGTTAYAGSSRASVGFTEDLAGRFIYALVSGKESTTIGEAFLQAKSGYSLDDHTEQSASSEDEIRTNIGDDLKVLSGLTLYGFPMLEVKSLDGEEPPHLNYATCGEGGRHRGRGVESGERVLWAEPEAIGEGLLRSERTEWTYDEKSGETFFREHETTFGHYYSFNGMTQTNLDEPLQPRGGYITGAEGFFPKGAVLESAKYRVIEDFDAVVEGDQWGVTESKEGVFEKKGFFPAIPFTVNTIPARNNLPPLQRFVFVLGQYKQETRQERLYDELCYSTYYTTNESDDTPPTVGDPSLVVQGERVLVSVDAEDVDGDPLYRVVVLWTDGKGEWNAEDLEQSSSNPLTWEGELTKVAGLEFFVQAVDTLGNVSYADNRGRYYRPLEGGEEPTPTPVPENVLAHIGFDEFSVEEAGFVRSPATGFEAGSISIGDVPPGPGTDGRGLIMEAQPGQGTLAISNVPVSVGEGVVMLSVNVRADGEGCSAALAALNSPIDGQLGYSNASGPDVPVGEWGQLVVLYDPPADVLQPGLQVALPDSAAGPVKVYFDNLIISELPELELEEVVLDVDGSFDGDTSGLLKNVMAQSGGSSVQFPDTSGGNNMFLSLSAANDASNIGISASRLQGGFPHVLQASVDVRLFDGSGGVTALVMTNGNGEVGVFVNNSGLAGDEFQEITVGGGFTAEDPGFPVLCVVQNGGPGVESSVLVDDLELRRVVGGM